MIIRNDYKKNTDNEYIERDNNETVKLAQELSKLTNEDISIIASDNRYDIKITKDYPIYFRKWGYGTGITYDINLWDHLKYINYDDKNAVIKDLGIPEPQKIRTFNDKCAKKIEQWISYQKKVYDALIIRSNDKQKKVSEFINTFKHAAAALLELDMNGPNYFREGTSGFDKTLDGSYSGMLTRGGISYEFSINTNGYIHQEIKTRYYPSESSMDVFVKMSNNQLR